MVMLEPGIDLNKKGMSQAQQITPQPQVLFEKALQCFMLPNSYCPSRIRYNVTNIISAKT